MYFLFLPFVVNIKTYKRSYGIDIQSCKEKKHSNTVKIIFNIKIFAFSKYLTSICHACIHN